MKTWNSLIFTILCEIKTVTQSEFTVCVYSMQRLPAEAVLDRASWPWKLCQGRDKQLSVWTPQPLVNWSSNGLIEPQDAATSWKSRAEKARVSTSYLHGLLCYLVDRKLPKGPFYRCHTTGTSISRSACPSLMCPTLSKPVREQPCKSPV